MNICKIDLSSLPESWQKTHLKELSKNEFKKLSKAEVFQSNDPLVDGTSMTVNNEIKYRRKRIVSKITPYKRTGKVQELLNYCKFRVGEIPTCEKPPKMVIKVLTDYKYKRLDIIPKAYLEAIELHKDLVEKAISIDLRGLNKSSKKKPTSKAKGTTVNKCSLKAKERAEQWIEKVKVNDKDALSNYTYVMHFVNWQKKRKMPELIREVFDKNEELLRNFIMKKTKLINTKYITTNAEYSENRVCVKSPRWIPVNTVTQEIKNEQTDTLSKLIKLAKAAGATELVIRL